MRCSRVNVKNKNQKNPSFTRLYNTPKPRSQVALVGGQDAADVTMTADAAGGFETHFFHKIYEEEFGTVRGHFGPVNSVAVAPDGKSFVTGGEDGFVRLQHFDLDYLATKFIADT